VSSANRTEVQGDQKVSVHLTIAVQSSGAQRLFDYPVALLSIVLPKSPMKHRNNKRAQN